MATLHIALHDGFAGDAVVVAVDGQEVFNRSGVKTDLRISRADAVDTETHNGAATVQVSARGRTAQATVDAAATPYVAVDLGPDGQPAIRASAEPFAYL